MDRFKEGEGRELAGGHIGVELVDARHLGTTILGHLIVQRRDLSLQEQMVSEDVVHPLDRVVDPPIPESVRPKHFENGGTVQCERPVGVFRTVLEVVQHVEGGAGE